jgi:hypothetical protein
MENKELKSIDLKISRRGLLRNIGIGILAPAGLAGAGYQEMRYLSENAAVIDFKTNGADYRFLGGVHGSPLLDKKINLVTKLKEEMIPENVTFFEPETGDLNYLDPKIYPYLELLYIRGEKGNYSVFNKDVISKLTRDKATLVLTDVYSPLGWATSLGAIPLAGLMGIISELDRNATRRKYLKAGAYTTILVTILKESLGTIFFTASQKIWNQEIANANHKFELMQPESLFITFRNSIIAAKTLGLEGQLPTHPDTGKPKGVLIYGTGHWGIPEYIKSGKQPILDYLSLYPRPFIETAFGKHNPHLFTSVVITPQKDEIKIEKVEDPDLKRIFA